MKPVSCRMLPRPHFYHIFLSRGTLLQSPCSHSSVLLPKFIVLDLSEDTSTVPTLTCFGPQLAHCCWNLMSRQTPDLRVEVMCGTAGHRLAEQSLQASTGLSGRQHCKVVFSCSCHHRFIPGLGLFTPIPYY